MNITELNDTDLINNYKENVEKFIVEEVKDERDRLNHLLGELMSEIVQRNLQI